MKKYLSIENLDFYKKYKYVAEDNTFLTSKYRFFWELLQKMIPNYIHPNVITLLGLISVIFGYNMMKTYSSNIIMGICVFLYMNFDAIDGIHARNIKNTSIIGEYLDHIIDLINAGMIFDCLMYNFGVDQNISNYLLTVGSFHFMIPHYEAIIKGKIIFEGLTDVSLILTTTSLVFLCGLKLPKILINNNILFLFIGGILLLNICKLLKLIYEKNSNHMNMKLGFYIGIWYLIKFVSTIIYPTKFIWTITIVDTVLLLEVITFKIFKKRSSNTLCILPCIFTYNPILLTPIIINFISNIMYTIANELKINLLLVKETKLRVFCCGVFDLCHLGHMMLFKKIYESFDVPIKLIVGVHGDDVCASYKRKPIINEKIRYRTVELCKYVDEIVENYPLVVTKDLIEKDKYDIVIIGEEYKGNKDKEWYPGAFDLNNYKYVSRFDEISTSDIIKTIKSL